MAALALAVVDPTGSTLIGLALTGVVKILGRLKAALKGNEEHVDSIRLKSDTIKRLQNYIKRYWATKKKVDSELLECIKKVEADLGTLLKTVETQTAWNFSLKVVLGISPGIKVQLDSVGSKLDGLIQNIEVRRMTDFNQPETLRLLQNLHERNVNRLQRNLASELAADNLKQLGKLTKEQYKAHVKFGVYVAHPRTEFPCTLYMSSSVPGCTKLILDFLRRFKDEAHLVTKDWSKLVGDCLVRLLTDVLPRELKKSLDLRRAHLSAQDASMLCANIQKLRSSLDNPAFCEIRRDCHVQVKSLSTWPKWEEVVRESEHIKTKLSKPHGQQRGQQHGHAQHPRQHHGQRG